MQTYACRYIHMHSYYMQSSTFFRRVLALRVLCHYVRRAAPLLLIDMHKLYMHIYMHIYMYTCIPICTG